VFRHEVCIVTITGASLCAPFCVVLQIQDPRLQQQQHQKQQQQQQVLELLEQQQQQQH